MADYATDEQLSLDDLCAIVNLNQEAIMELIEHEVIHPQGDEPPEWNFDLNELKRLKRALRLKRDLQVNVEGLAILLNLLEEVDDMRAHIQLLEKHYFHHD